MSTKSTACEQILGRIRAALRDVPNNEQPQDVVVPLDYRRSETAPREEVVERFVERVAEYKVNVQRVDEASLPAAIAAACTARNIRHLVIPTDLPGQWLPTGVELLHDDNTLTNEQLDTSDGVLTGCALGIAQTGTIVLDDGPHQGRRAITLLPDYHLCVMYEDQIVYLVPEAITGLHDAAVGRRQRISINSGPANPV